MKTALLGASLLALFASTGVNAAVTGVSTADITSIYTGPSTIDFDTKMPASYTGGSIITTGSGAGHAQPAGSTGNFYSVGPTDGATGTIMFGKSGASTVSFLWGSVDGYNALQFVDSLGNAVGSSFGGAMFPPSGGDQSVSRLVTFSFTGADAAKVAGMRLTSSSDAFEIDNVNVSAVPEASSWAMMIAGIGGAGGMLRRQPRRKLAIA